MKKLISRTEAGADMTYNVRKGLKSKRRRSKCPNKNRNAPVPGKSERNKLTAALEAFEAQVQRDRTARVAKEATIGRSASKTAPVKSNKNKKGRRSCAPEVEETREAEEDAFQTEEDDSQATPLTDNTKSYKHRMSQDAEEREGWEESAAVTTSDTKEVLGEYGVALPKKKADADKEEKGMMDKLEGVLDASTNCCT